MNERSTFEMIPVNGPGEDESWAYLVPEAELNSLFEQLEATRDALDKGRRFERAYQESLGATPTATQFEILDNLQSAFLDAYLAVDSFPAKREAD